MPAIDGGWISAVQRLLSTWIGLPLETAPVEESAHSGLLLHLAPEHQPH